MRDYREFTGPPTGTAIFIFSRTLDVSFNWISFGLLRLGGFLTEESAEKISEEDLRRRSQKKISDEAPEKTNSKKKNGVARKFRNCVRKFLIENFSLQSFNLKDASKKR